MFYFDSVTQPLENLKKTLDHFESENNSSIKTTSQAILERYFFISLYTIWETYITDIVANVYKNNEDLLNSADFDYYYYDNIFSSKNLKKKVKDENIELKNVDVNYIFSTNNLWFQNITAIFKVYGFDINSLECYFNKKVNIENSLKLLHENSLPLDLVDVETKVGIKVKKEKRSNYHKIQLYVGFLVDQRNKLAHKYKSPYPNYDKATLINISLLFETVFDCFDIYIKEQLLQKKLEKSNLYNPIDKIELLDKKKSCEKKLKLKITMKEDMNTGNDTLMIFYHEEKNIHEKFRIFKFESIEESDITTLKKGKSYDVILNSLNETGAMRKDKVYNYFLEN